MTQPKKIILISIDTLRADHLGCYGYQRNTSPVIDDLAKNNIVFNYAFTSCSFTLPAHASMFTSKYSKNHSVQFDNAFGKLNPDIDITVAEVLQSNGYKTAAFVSALVLRKGTNLDMGFQHYDDEMTSSEPNRKEELIRDGFETTNRATHWIKEHLSEDFFVFIHYFDVHGPYVPPDQFKHLFINDHYYGSKFELNNIVTEDNLIHGIPNYQILEPQYDVNGKIISFEKDIRFYIAQYDSCIKYCDYLIGLFLDNLKTQGIYDDCLIIITADHGESLGENDIFFYHGLSVTPDQILIPFIIKPPNNLIDGLNLPMIIDTPVSIIDIMPTILSLCNIDFSDLFLEGYSLPQLTRINNLTTLTIRQLLSENEYQTGIISPNCILETYEKDPPSSNYYPVVRETISALNGKKYFLQEERELLKNKLEWTGERYLPFIDPEISGAEIHYEHLHRYAFASQFVNGRKVLDLACGEGYGAFLLSRTACFVTGIDINPKTIRHASNAYPKNNLEFKEGSILNVPISGSKIFDVIVCFEALEHITGHEILLSEISRLLKEDGLLIISTPNKKIYTELRNYHNPFHEKELYFDEFKDLLKTTFSNIKFFGQRILTGSNIFPLSSKELQICTEFVLNRENDKFSFKNGYDTFPIYYIAIASNGQLDDSIIAKSFLIDASNSEISLLSNQVTNLNRALAVKNQQIKEISTQVTNLNQALAVKDQQIREISTQIQEISTQVTNLNQALAVKDQQIQEISTQVTNLNQTLAVKDQEINKLYEQNYGLKEENTSLKNSISFRMVSKFHKVLIEPIFPHNSKRREIYDLGLKGGRIAVNEGFGKAISEYKKHRTFKKKSLKNNNNSSSVCDTSNLQIHGVNPDQQDTIFKVFSAANMKSPEYVPFSQNPVSLTPNDIKSIAFYLPQFHPIPENDRWWGKGFTDWTNVTKSLPQFNGHYQPHFPDEFGYYDLRLPEVQKQQIELARHYGIYGFCFHYYWFNGKRLLEKPLDQFIDHKEMNFPFCICWANENWTRRWDGMEKEILIAQIHSRESDLQFIKDLDPYLRDPRYIKVNGKPLIIVYRAGILPEVRETTKCWREYCQKVGIGDVCLVAALSFGFDDPYSSGFDAAVEFPPHTMTSCIDITEKVKSRNPDFQGRIFDFVDFVKSKKFKRNTPYKLFKTVVAGWDNTARRGNRGHIFAGANPELYREWLSDIIEETNAKFPPEERFVFINAWNEWAEGTHLEPDKKFGYGYLQATADAIIENRIYQTDGHSNNKYKKIKTISDEQWHDILIGSINKPEYKGLKLPGFPSEEIQKNFVGSAFGPALTEGYNFYRILKRYSSKYGISTDSKTKILDFGCGWGRITRFLLKDFDPQNICGADVDPSIISVCRQTIEGIHFIQCNPFPPLEFPDDSFDIIYAYSVFSHLSEDYALQWIQEFSRILKPGGILLATTQSGRFLDFCQAVRDNNLNGNWYNSLKVSFTDIHQCRKDFENGTFLFAPTGGGDYRDKAFYGQAIIPKKYIWKTYAKYLQPVEFIDDERILPQALFILQKKKIKTEDNPKAKNNKLQVSCTTADFFSLKNHRKKIIIVSHDAHLWGAQMLALHIAKVLHENFHYEVHMLLKSGGRLEEDFKKYSIVYNLERDYPDRHSVEKLLASLHKNNVNIAICNTVVTGDLVEILVKNSIKTISLVHELPGVIHQYKQEENAQKISKYADTIVFPAEYVKKNFSTVTPLNPVKCRIHPQGLFLKNRYKDRKEEAQSLLREKLALPMDSKIVLGVGSADFRKGADLFVQVAKNVIKDNQDVFFVWVGQKDANLMKNIDPDIENSGLSKKILFVGIRTDDLDVFYSGADIFLLTSREDPFPSVVLDAMNAGVPVIGFQDAGGFQDIVTDVTGVLVPYSDIEKMSERATFFLRNQDIRSQLGRNAAELIDKQFSFVDYIYFLLEQLGHDYKKVSVIIPNYNYSSYLDDRFNTIIKQKYPVYEIIFLDDCSSDDSVEKIKRYVDSSPVPVRIFLNNTNSGSVFRQWGKGISTARGDYIWIAEADDLSEDLFLFEVMKGFLNPDVVLSYAQSRLIDNDGKDIGPDYQNYTYEIDESKWSTNYTRKGTLEICDSLVIKNTIPNISAVVFKKMEMTGILDELVRFKNAGDWYFYVWLLQRGNIYFVSESLNIHRRHKNSVTQNENPQSHFNEIVSVQDYILSHFDVDENNVKKALQYRDYVKKYFFAPHGK